ncbi:DUF4190 domain-containing protein [Streptomyces sp. NPDC006739]|uniref:DUF4190 domain-containing protein n=1 Tax=Streptomyces sp. NPDC006739 TaxID=3364763 RepID=UPI0036A88C50
MTDQTGPGGAQEGFDPWAAPGSGPSLEKGPQPAAPGQPPAGQPPVRPPSVHDQATMVSMPAGGAPVPPAGGFGAPGWGPSGGGQGWTGSAVPPPPIAPSGPGMQAPPPGGYGYPAYPQGYGWPGMPMQPNNGMGTAAMVLGILSCCLFCIYGVVSLVLGTLAVIFGIKGKKRADRGEATNRGQAQAGLVTGIIGILLGIATIVSLIIGITMAVEHEKQRRESDPSYNSAPSVSAPVLVRG